MSFLNKQLLSLYEHFFLYSVCILRFFNNMCATHISLFYWTLLKLCFYKLYIHCSIMYLTFDTIQAPIRRSFDDQSQVVIRCLDSHSRKTNLVEWFSSTSHRYIYISRPMYYMVCLMLTVAIATTPNYITAIERVKLDIL